MNATAVFAAHVACAPGMQGLEYIDAEFRPRGVRTIRIQGGDPCAPTDSHLLVNGPDLSSFRYGHPYVHTLPLDKRPATEIDERLLAWLQASMNWVTRAGIVCIVNPRLLACDARFVGIHLANFQQRLRSICEQVVLQPQ